MSVKITSKDGLYDCFKVKCPKCGVEFEYTRRDIRPHRRWPNGFIYCPKCKIPVGHDNDNFTHNKLDDAEKQRQEAARHQSIEDEKPSKLSYEEYLQYRREVKTLMIPQILFLIFGISFMIIGTILMILWPQTSLAVGMVGLFFTLSGIALIVVRAAVFSRMRKDKIYEVRKYERQHPEIK